MKYQTLSMIVVAIFLAIASVNSLNIVHEKQAKQAQHLVEVVQTQVYNHLCDYYHLKPKDDKPQKGKQPQNPLMQQFMMQFLGLAFTNPTLLADITSGKISPESAKIIKDFFVNNDKFINMIFEEINKGIPDDKNCFKTLNLSLDQKKKIVSIVMDAIDWNKVVNSDKQKGKQGKSGKQGKDSQKKQTKELTPEQKKKINDAIRAEPTLGPSVADCAQQLQKYQQENKKSKKP